MTVSSCSAEGDRNLGYRDFAMRIRLFIVTLTLFLCVIAVRADKPIVIKESETTCPHAASFCLRARLSQFFAKIEGGCEWPDLGVRLVSSAHPDVRQEPLGLAPGRCHFSSSMRIKAGVQRCNGGHNHCEETAMLKAAARLSPRDFYWADALP